VFLQPKPNTYICVLKQFMKRFFTYILIIGFFTFLAGCKNSKKTEKPLTKNIDTLPHIIPSNYQYKPLTANYKKFAKNHVEQFALKNWKGKNNYAFLVAKNGEIIFEKYEGFTDIVAQKPITTETPLHIASVSKVLTAAAVLILINAKKIDLNQKVNTILPTFPYSDVSVKDLLSHRSGMRNYAYFTEDVGVWNRKVPLSNADLLRILSEKSIKQDCPANKRFCYCNTNYAILALIIEKKTGLKYPTAMKKMIFDPLDMKNTFVFDLASDKGKVSKTYKNGGREIGFDYLDEVYGDKNIYSTPRDLLKFDLAKNAPTFLSEKLRTQMYEGYSNEKKGSKNYGLGLRMINFDNGQNYYFHNGWWHGNTSSYITLKKENVTIIALSNKFTTLTYRVRNLSKYFGNYPFVIKDSLE
jgi:CubicO group peptidase (beta-lactamase class C family)